MNRFMRMSGLLIVLALVVSGHALAKDEPKTDDKKKFLTPAELFEQIKARQDAAAREKQKQAEKIQVARIDLDGPVVEVPTSSLFGGESGNSLRTLIQRLRDAAADDEIDAVFIHFGTGSGVSLAHAQEIRPEIQAIRDAGKRVFTYADVYGTGTYLLASAASDVCILQAGEAFMPGIGVETMFYKGLMEKLGVVGDFIQIGEFKGAEEPYTRGEPSAELQGELNRLTRSLYDQVVEGIAISRGKSAEDVRRLIDDAMIPADQLLSRGYVDHTLAEIDDIKQLMADELGGEVNLRDDYGAPEKKQIDFSNPFAFLAQLAKPPVEKKGPKIAVIYAVGTIVDGEGTGGLFDAGGVGSDKMRRAIRLAERDDDVKAVVLRIDSPGGSALASEIMWQGLRRLAAKKPLVVSVGGMAASGGYYLLSSSDTVYADPAAIVGSIGVVGGKFVLGGLYDKLGLGTATFTQGANADIFSMTKPWNDAQRRMIKRSMTRTYEQFTDRIMTTRAGKIADIDAVARGRIFTAREAKDLGMVDKLGGIEDAIAHAAELGGLSGEDFDIKTLPPPPTLADLLQGGGGIGLTLPVSSDSMLALQMLPADVRQNLMQQLSLVKTLEKRPVALISPYVIRID